MTQDSAKPWYSDRDIATTLVKGIKVLSAFDSTHAQLSLPDIGRITGFDRATVRRLVITLVALGFVTKTGAGFSLTPKVLTLSGSYLRSHGVGATVQPVLDRYSERIGKEISLATVSDGSAIYLARSHMTGAAVSFGFTVGSRLPLFHTAIGRMLLANSPSDGVDGLIAAGPLVRYTADTLMEHSAIGADVDTARAKGFAWVSNEFEAGVAGLAVSVGRLGEARTVVGISAPTADLQEPTTRAEWLSTLQFCANELDRVWTQGP